jgi:hypothetical protein
MKFIDDILVGGLGIGLQEHGEDKRSRSFGWGAARLVGVEGRELVLEGVVGQPVAVQAQKSEKATMGREAVAETALGGGQLNRRGPAHGRSVDERWAKVEVGPNRDAGHLREPRSLGVRGASNARRGCWRGDLAAGAGGWYTDGACRSSVNFLRCCSASSGRSSGSCGVASSTW